MIDTYRHKGLRVKLVETLRTKGITNEAILKAFIEIPRHYFLDKAFSDWAYRDVAFPIDSDQTISQPYTVAFQTTLLDVHKGDKILEIGTGSGFQACVLSYLGAKTYTIERQKALHDKTEKFLQSIGFDKIRTLFGDGYLGAPRYAPYDKILVTAGAMDIPSALIDQLKPGGILVIPHTEGDSQMMKRIVKQADSTLKTELHGEFRFVPFLQGVNR